LATLSAPTATSAATNTPPPATSTIAPSATSTAAPTKAPPTATATATLKPPTATATPRPPTMTPIPPTVPPPAAPSTHVELNGRGQQAIPGVHLLAGLMTVNSSFTGQYNFIAELQDSTGKTVALLANTIGTGSTSKAFRVPATGDYILNVTLGNGPWSFEFVPIGAFELQAAVPLPQSFSGTGNQNTPLFIANAGAVFVAGSHTGKSNFFVEVLDSRGQTVALAANAIGNTTTSQSIRIPTRGIYIFVVTADGDWTVEAK